MGFLEEGKDLAGNLGPLLVRLNERLLLNKPQSPYAFIPTTFKTFSMSIAFNTKTYTQPTTAPPVILQRSA